jgi:hypothetical protein
MRKEKTRLGMARIALFAKSPQRFVTRRFDPVKMPMRPPC